VVVAAHDRRAASPALVVPDEQSWIVWGLDPLGEGFEPVLDRGRVRRVLLPDAVPEALVGPLADCLDELPLGVRVEHRSVSGLIGASLGPKDTRSLGPGEDRPPDPASNSGGEHMEHGGAGEHEHEDAEGHGGHEDMMAITGAPSADGLVMEPIGFSLGPLGSPLPGGLVADVVLDGDVVAQCTVRALLRQPRPLRGPSLPAPPDLMAPRSWAAVIAAVTEADTGRSAESAAAWLGLAGVELERAGSHLAWLRGLARLLGWVELVERTTVVLAPLLSAQASLRGPLATLPTPDLALEGTAGPLASASAQAHSLQRLCAASRRLASRTAGRGVLSAAEARGAGVTGPAARASGVREDTRNNDTSYQALDFTPAVRQGGDARARALLRVEEACASIELAQAALGRARTGASAPVAVAAAEAANLEGPRGPLRARRVGHELRLEAPGQTAALAAAGRAAVGLEWAAALVVLVSFDLSPWQVER